MLQRGRMRLLPSTWWPILRNMKRQEGKPIFAHGGVSFAQNLVKHGLVDEFRFSIHSVAIGKGISGCVTIPI
ncbi:dihydrofolate reductase family protein [Adhaeribacter arboris]